MKTVAAGFKTAQESPGSVLARRVSYKRRYWNGSSYVWEAGWTILPENAVINTGAVTAKLDTDRLNEFKISNVSITLKNDRRQWTAANPSGYFGTTGGVIYESFWTKFRIESGWEVNGVATYTPLFVGVATSFTQAAGDDSIQIDVQGLEAILINSNAEDVSTTVTLETLGTGNGSNKDFTTAQPGVGIISLVTVDDVAQKGGTAYNTSQMNEPTLGAKITFATAPAAGKLVKATYKYWKQDKTIESLVSDLATASGIDVGNQSIDTVVFGSSISDIFKADSQADWLAGTFSNTEGTTSAGDVQISHIFDTFTDGNYTSNPTWTVLSGTWTASSGYLKTTSATGEIRIDSTQSVGEWRFSVGGGYGRSIFKFITGGAYEYSLKVETAELFGNPLTTLELYRDSTSLGSYIYGIWAGNIIITRTGGGNIGVYQNGILRINVTDALTTTSVYSKISTSADVGGRTDLTFDDIYFGNYPIVGDYTTAIFDAGSTPSGWGVVSKIETLNGGTISVSTASSADGSTWDAFVAVGGSGQILSALKRYLKIKFTLTAPSYNQFPVLHSFEASYLVIATVIKLANFTGKTCYDAIQSLGAFANYEWGFTADEVFFFRSKDPSLTVDETLTASKNVIELSAIESGFDRVYSEVEAKYGNFTATVSDSGMVSSGPLARFKKRRFIIDSGDLLLNNDTDMAAGIAQQFYNFVSIPRRRMKAKTKLMQWLDLSDTVTVTFYDNLPARVWWLGDTTVGMTADPTSTAYYWGDGDQTAVNLLCKVIGYRHDMENAVSEFDLEEIV